MPRRLLLFLALVPATVVAAPDAAYLAELVARARELRLAERPEWRKLVHYEPDFLGRGLHSLVDSAWFFNSPRGKTDPQAELEATLESFFAEIAETPQQQNPQCAFIARRTWLDNELNFDTRRLPRRHCPRYSEWHAALNVRGLTLIFASGYQNVPASMYGHTLLRFDARDQDERTRLLAYALNFGANTTDTNGLAYVVNGLLGGYPGTFSIQPYYLKVREYNHMENRDIWEYELNLTSPEIDRVVQHTWELLPAYFQYFFFDENCSYHLLGLLQVARPDLELTAPFRWWALPSDTVRQVTRQAGLVARAMYRPANSTIISARLAGMSAQERALVKDLSLAKVTPGVPALRALPATSQAAVLETAHDYGNYRRARGESEPDPAALARSLLIARSQVDAPSQAPAIAPPEHPDDGHGTARLWLGAGRRGGRDFGEVQVRPVYQDIMDPDAGYTRGAQTELFNISVRSYEGDGPRVEHFIPIEVVSISPRDEFFEAKSWRVSAGWRRNFIHDGSEPLVTNVDGGMGGTWQLGDKARAYALAEGGLRQHHSLEGGYSVGAGARVGGFIDPAPAFRLHAYAQGLSYFAGERDTPQSAALQARLSLTRDIAFRAELGSGRQAGKRLDTGSLSLQIYF